MVGVHLNTAGSDEPATPPVVFIDQTLVVFDVEKRKNASQILQISRVSKNAPVSFRFQTNAPTRYIVNPNCGVLLDNKPVSVRIELVGNRFNPQHKIVLHAAQIENINEWKTKPSHSVVQLLSASNAKGAARVKELEDLKAMLKADNDTILKNIEQTINLKNVIEKQLAERKTEASDLQMKAEKLSIEENNIYSELEREENELRLMKERRGGPDNCIIM